MLVRLAPRARRAARAPARVVAVDFLGFGLSDKPDLRYRMRMQADVVEGVAPELGLTSVALLTHDMGDTVGGELLARSLEGTLPFAVTRRVLTNGSIYIDMAHLTTGQQLLLSLDDAPTELVSADGYKAGPRGDVLAEQCGRRRRARGAVAPRRAQRRQPAAAAHDPLHRRPSRRGTTLHRRHRDPPVAARSRVGRRRSDRRARR